MFDIIQKCKNGKPFELNLTSLLDETNLDGSGVFVEKDDTFFDPNTSVRFLIVVLRRNITNNRTDRYTDI